ncbi:hypothetical protein AVEN_101075-1 [Araneus ventricosus]|uniref:Uncharacterized protein n=1 Tax=Araneus ventricosus TaxID=182803 RepID=A0A4Y2SCC6_ARAVE|nr:hypothetical protein AVEN_101075-1 [Araneus ventricosus]
MEHELGEMEPEFGEMEHDFQHELSGEWNTISERTRRNFELHNVLRREWAMNSKRRTRRIDTNSRRHLLGKNEPRTPEELGEIGLEIQGILGENGRRFRTLLGRMVHRIPEHTRRNGPRIPEYTWRNGTRTPESTRQNGPRTPERTRQNDPRTPEHARQRRFHVLPGALLGRGGGYEPRDYITRRNGPRTPERAPERTRRNGPRTREDGRLSPA